MLSNKNDVIQAESVIRSSLLVCMTTLLHASAPLDRNVDEISFGPTRGLFTCNSVNVPREDEAPNAITRDIRSRPRTFPND